MANTAKLSSSFRVSIPKSVREEMRWKAGQQLVLIPEGKGLLIMPASELSELVGAAEGADKAKTGFPPSRE